MTAYQGGKKRLGKQISEVIKKVEKEHGKENMDYLEPFCGMLGVVVHMVDGKRKITCNDLNEDLILMWKAVKTGWIPENKYLTKEDFERMRQEKPNKERGFYGVVCSFNNEFLGPYRHPNNTQNYVEIGISNLTKMKDDIKNIDFTNNNYSSIKTKSKLVYCDPPYKGNGYKYNKWFKFDHEEFWDKIREWSKDNIVIISEYNAPNDFICIWEKKLNLSYNIERSKVISPKLEKLFIHKSLVN
jgi:DNA adenine methylase